jgi:hypothetical protein
MKLPASNRLTVSSLLRSPALCRLFHRCPCLCEAVSFLEGRSPKEVCDIPRREPDSVQRMEGW